MEADREVPENCRNLNKLQNVLAAAVLIEIGLIAVIELNWPRHSIITEGWLVAILVAEITAYVVLGVMVTNRLRDRDSTER